MPGGRKVTDHTGERFGKLVALEIAERRTLPGGHKTVLWRCRCDCGKETIVYANNLAGGVTTSCGCLRGRWRKA